MWKSIRSIFSLNDPGWGRGGGGDKDQEPRRPNQDGQDGPPDLDELWRDFNRRLNGLFGRRGGGGGPRLPIGGGGGGGVPTPSFKGAGIGLVVLFVAAALLWLASGFFIVQEGQTAIVLRFGKVAKQIDRAGFTWRLPFPIEVHEIVSTQQLRTVEIGYRGNPRNKNLRESLMLTGDQSIVDMQYTMQYRIGSARDYLFNNDLGGKPEEIARQAAETAMREVVGRAAIDRVLYEEKDLVARDALKLVQSILDRYGLGASVVDITIQQVQPPEQVQEAFADANKAAQDRERLINEGVAYANDVVPRAQGMAARLMQEAEGYRSSAIASAEGDAERFTKVMEEYAKAPRVTRDRLYIEAMQQVFSNTSKIMVDGGNGGNLLYLPLDKLIAGAGGATAADPTRRDQATTTTPAPSPRGAATDDFADTRREALRNRDRDAFR
ncbi:MAG: FtsH protease activity modulator HflK [Burkholderiaceae bacterium]|jgi:membrane protease subunit HflK|nr:FtsH protease activity modulator HflK [Burkholderiaceae bacterium]MEB2319356.1 FtsH protease activity modulator HflK [Pseudomonadota bacterium]